MRKSPTPTSERSSFSTEKTLRWLASNTPNGAAEVVAPPHGAQESDGAQSPDAEAAGVAEAAQSAAAGLAEPARAVQGAAAAAAPRGAPAGSFARRELFPDCVQRSGSTKDHRFDYCDSARLHADGQGCSWLL